MHLFICVCLYEYALPPCSEFHKSGVLSGGGDVESQVHVHVFAYVHMVTQSSKHTSHLLLIVFTYSMIY